MRVKKEFAVWCPEQGETSDDAWQCQAFDAEDAAEEWAEHEDYSSAEYDIVGQRTTPQVYVLEAGTTEARLFRVSGEAVPSYYAEELSTTETEP